MDRGVHYQAEKSMAVSGLGCRMALVGTEWLVSLLCMNGLRKQSSHLVEPAVKLYPSVDELAVASRGL